MVLWQVGTNDAFAQVPVEDFEPTVGNTVRWLKEHNVDVILVGLHYMKQLAKNEHYQAIRTSLQRITTAENVLRITRYEAMEVLARTMRENGRPEPRDFGLTRPATTAWRSMWRAPSPSACSPSRRSKPPHQRRRADGRVRQFASDAGTS